MSSTRAVAKEHRLVRLTKSARAGDLTAAKQLLRELKGGSEETDDSIQNIQVAIETLIEQQKPGWLARAATRTAGFKALGKYDESSGIWSEIKPVYMRLQHSKCAYCERQLESEAVGRIEHDLEHFRPKKKAKPWKITSELAQAGVALTPPTTGSADKGYHLLAYHPQNYCTSCKPCNSALKSDNFPIEGPRTPGGEEPTALNSEQPYLVNPVGDFDDAPQDLIAFHGLSPMAKASSGFKRRRGLVSIKFFRLDDRRRKYLFRERADRIVSLFAFLQLVDLNAGTALADTWQGLVDIFTAADAPHCNCARSFHKLYNSDKPEAQEIFNLSNEYLQSISS